MNWDAIGAIGEMIGSVAVLATLGYLAVQVKHARSEVRRSVNSARFEAVRQLALARATNVPLNTAYKNAIAAMGGSTSPFISELMASGAVTQEQAAAVQWDQFAWAVYRAQMIHDVDELPPGERASFNQAIIGSYRSFPLGRLWYEANKAAFSADAVLYIDNLLAQPG